MKTKKNVSSKFGVFLLAVFIASNFSGIAPLATKEVRSACLADGNLIANSSFEIEVGGLPQYWKKGGFGKNKAVFTYPVAGFNSDKAVRIDMTQRTGGDAKWYFEEVPVAAGQEYEFGDIYFSTVATSVVVQFKMVNGSFSYLSLAANLQPSADWKQFKKTFTVPPDAKSATVFHLIKKIGSLVLDDYSLKMNDKEKPAANIVWPAPGQTISGSGVLKAQASDNIGISGVQFIIDNVNFGSEITVVPYELAIDALKLSEGNHLIFARVRDFAGNTADSAIISFNVLNEVSKPSSNLIKNPSLETADISGLNPDSWRRGNWGENQVQFVYPSIGFDQSRAASINMTQYVSGDAKWYFDEVAVISGKQYRFSDRYISDIETSVTLRYFMNDGSFRYIDLARLASAAGWQDFKSTFTVPDGAVSATIFHLINGMGSLSIDEFYLGESAGSALFERGMVSINFDDGWLSAYNNGLPILDSAYLKSTQYIITAGLSDPVNYVNAQQVLAMQEAGHEIGAHSKTHADLTQISDSQLKDEVAGSRADLLAAGVKSVDSFAYPYGASNAAVEQALKDAGFIGARGTNVGLNTKDTNSYQLQAKDVVSGTAASEIKALIDDAVKNKTWLILFFHEIDNSGRKYSYTPEGLREIADYLKQNNVLVVTNSEGIRLMEQ